MRGLWLPILAFVAVCLELRAEETLSPGARIRITAPKTFEVSGGFKTTPEAWKERFGKSDLGVITVTHEEQNEFLTLPRPGKTLKGRLLSFDDEVFTVQLDGETSPSRIPREAIARVQVGHSSRGNAILRGAVIGAAVGVSFALAVDPGLVVGHPSEVAQSVGVPGAMLGALIGAIRPGERWRTADPRAVHTTVPSNGAGGLQLGLAPQGRGMGVSLSVKF